MENSFCPPERIEQLKKFTSDLDYSSFALIYKASVDGYGGEDFHKKCDGKKKIVVLIKANNYIFGGYTKTCFKSRGDLVKGKESFIFSLSNPENRPLKMKCVKPKESIDDTRKDGPCFGYNDIKIGNNSNQNEESFSEIEGSYVGNKK